MATSYVASVVRTASDLEPLKTEWNALADRAETPLLGHEWFSSCAHTLSSEGQLRVVTIRRHDQLVGVAPLVLKAGHGAPRLELLGMAALHEPSGFLFADAVALEELVGVVAELGLPLVLQRLDSDSPLPQVLRRVLPWPGVVLTKPTAPSLSVPVLTTWAEYHVGLSSRITGNLRRLKARADQLGGTTVEVLSPKESDVDSMLELVMAVEGSGWKGAAGSAIQRKAGLRAFFFTYSRLAARLGVLRIALLRFGNQLAAVELAVEAYRRWWQLKIGYLDELSRFYPGLQLTEATIRYAFDHSLRSYEFLGSAAGWEERWRPKPHPCCMAIAYPRSLNGVRALSADAWHAGRKRIANFAHGFDRPEP